MNRSELKQHVVELLQQNDLAEIGRQLLELPEKKLINPLFSCLCHSDERIRWHAVSGFGVIVPNICRQNLEQSRTIMRRFLWMLNDESGGIGWGIPEAMAEVMFNCRPLGNEYLHMLVSYTLDDGPELFQAGNFLELDLMQEGVLWGLCRVAPSYKEKLLHLGVGAALQVYFHSTNHRVRGLVCRLAGILELEIYKDQLVTLLEDAKEVRLYHQGRFEVFTVGDLARSALKIL